MSLPWQVTARPVRIRQASAKGHTGYFLENTVEITQSIKATLAHHISHGDTRFIL